MKTSHTTYSNFAKRVIILLVVLTTIGISSAWGETLTLSNLGKNISTASNDVKTTTIVATGDNTETYTINYKQCSSQSNSGNYAMFLKKGVEPFISNKTPIPGNIKSVTIYILTGASSSTSYHCAFSTTECTSVYTTGSTAQMISGGSSKKYTCEVDNARYFCISLGNNNNGQVWKIDVEYEVVSGSSYTVNWYVNNSLLHTQTDVVGTVLSSMPTPTKLDCDNEKVFVGWTTSAYSHATTAPSTLITNTSGMTIPEGGADYHAVFAKPNPDGTEQRTVTLSPPDVENTRYEYGTIEDSENNTWNYYASIQNQYGTLCFGLNSNNSYHIESHKFGGYVKSVSFKAYHSDDDEARLFLFCSSYTDTPPIEGDLATISVPIGQKFQYTYTANFTQDVDKFYIYASGGAFITDISVTYACAYSDYTTNCTNKTFSVTYEANGAESGSAPVDPKSPYDNGSNVIVLDNTGNLARSGFTFNGWNTERDGSGTPYDAGSTFVITEDVTLYAQWKARPLTNYRTSCSYTVTWQANGGQWGDGKMEDIVQEYNVGEEINKPTDPTSDGYRFLGWSEDGTNIVKPESTMPAENLTYIAIWEKEYSVTYNPNGGNTTCVDNNAYIMGETVTVCATEPTKIGYTFAGWNDGTYTYQAGSQFSMPANNVTLTAQWTANTNTPYAVEHYQQNLDGTYPATPYETDALTGTTDATVTPSVKTYEGFTAPATQTVTIVADGTTVVEYYYTRNSYTLTWDVNGGNETAAGTPAGSVKYGAQLTAPQVEREGYTFAGWDPSVPATMPAEDQTFTAIWENCRWVETDIDDIQPDDEVVVAMKTVTGTYALDSRKGTEAAPPATIIYPKGNEIPTVSVESYDTYIIWNIKKEDDNLIFHPIGENNMNLYCNTSDSNNDRVRIGRSNNAVITHKFVIEGNYLKNSITNHYLGIYYKNATPQDWRGYANSAQFPNQTLKLYKRVCIEENQHWVTWDANGGLFADGSATKTDFFTVGAPITHPTPTREGYTFTGWAPATNTMPNEDIALVAQWQVNSYTVTWNANGGKFGNETSVKQDYTYGATITAPTPTRTGYTFAGWDSEVPATMPARNLTYNAQWNCTSPTDIKINGAYIVFPGETIELTVTGNNIADDATYIWKKGDQIIAGQTTATLTIPNCVVGDAANYKCVVTNGACSAENNFTVKMYRLRGLTDPENNWTTDFVFSKAEGKTATYEITLNGASNYKFKVHDGSAYYGNNEGGDNPNPTMTHDNCTNWTMQENKGYNVILQTTITGVYTFVLDYTDESNPKISVIYPKKKIIYLNPNIWDAGNATEYYTVYSWGTAGSKFEPMELADCNGQVYMAEIDAAHTQVIFIRYERHVTNFNEKWNQTIDIPLDANNPQYRIDGWENNSNDKKSYGGWEQYTPYYSISYNMNGHGQSIGDICIKKDDIWIAPDDPSEVGYTFLGWRRPAETGDNTLYKKGVTGFPVVSDEELTAQWSFSMEYAITGTANVTSAVGQTIKATTPLQLAVSNMPVGTKVTISAPNITFYDEAGNVITELATKYNPESFTLTAAYTPIVANTTEQPTITLSVLGNEKTFDGLISARSLPETFAIVAKVGNIWYALPSQGLNSTDDLMGYAIEVDNQDDPTLVTNVPANADWSLRQVYAASHNDAQKDRFKLNGANIMFENNASPAKMLNASASKNYLLTNAEYDNYKTSDNQGLYEWTPTTTDLETYQLTNAYRTDRKLSIDILTRFGVYAGEITNMRFLPIQNRYTPAALQVVEWKENSVVVMYTGDPSQTATLAINGTEQVGTTTLNSVQKDIAIYELPANGIANKATQRLCITIGTSKKWLTIPYIINGSQTAADVLNSTSTTKAVAAVTDVVVLDGATLTAAGNKNDKYTFRTIHVYGGGKLVVPASATEGLGIYSLILRSGTVENGTYTNSYPQLVMNGKYSNTSGIYLDYITTYERYYALSVPYPVKTKNIKYPADIYGDNLKSGNTASFALQYYDGAARATGASGWKDFDESGAEPTLTPYQGYTFWGAPRKVSVNGGTAQRPKYGIHRIQLTGVGADDLLKSENEDKTINITAHPADRPNDMGWNFLGNPYLAQYGGLSASDEDVQVGLLEEEWVDGRWTGGWKHTGNLRYITITTDGQTYTPVEVDKATFSPFNTFFIQAAKVGALQFASASRAQNAPARHYAAQQETVKEITTGIILTGNDQTDRTGLLIADNFTEEYDYNADLSKFENSGINLYTIGKTGNLAYMAINQALAEQPIPVGYTAPAEGLYTIAFDEDRYNATDISALYLIDYDSNEKTNLLHTDYSFVTAAGTNNQRFALQVAFAPENATNVEWVGDATVQVGVEGNTLMLNNLPTDASVHVFDALGRLMYHAPTVPTEMQLTLPTGYYLVRIADKQNAVVIKTVIP